MTKHFHLLIFPHIYTINGEKLKEETGNILKNKREELGLSVSQVSRMTRIREDYINALENSSGTEIPDSYYSLFLKKYAGFLKTDLPEEEKDPEKSDAIVELLSEKNNGHTSEHIIQKRFKKLLLFLYVRRAFMLVLALLFFIFLFTRHIYVMMNAGEKSERSESMVKIITIEGDPDDRISINVKDSIMLDDDKPEPFILKISARDSCYICYFTDTLKVKETILMPGQAINLRAENVIEAKLGKSNSVALELNDVKVLHDLEYQKNASSFIRATHSGADRIKRSERIGEYLFNTYGLE